MMGRFITLTLIGLSWGVFCGLVFDGGWSGLLMSFGGGCVLGAVWLRLSK